jgi:hypothetical protein
MSGSKMSGPNTICPDWTGLVALRERAADAANTAEPAGWAAAVTHLDACPRCRREAMAADPLLVFRRLPVTEMPEAVEQAEAESMRQAVAAMRTAKRLESRRSFAGWRRWAAAAVLAVASLALGNKAPVNLNSAPAASEAVTASESVAAAAAPAAPSPAATAVLERLDGSDARVYQVDGKDLTAFMIVGDKVDV